MGIYNSKGQILVEVLTVFGLLTIFLVALNQLMVSSLVFGIKGGASLTAESLLSGGVEQLVSIERQDFNQLNNGTFYATASATGFNLVESVEGELIGNFRRRLNISDAYRDNFGHLVEDGGVVDEAVKKAVVTVESSASVPPFFSRQRIVYLTRLLPNANWQQTTAADFELGTHYYTRVVNNEGGEVEISGGCEPGKLPTPNIYDDGFRNGWGPAFFQLGSKIKEYETQPPDYVYEGQYSFSIKFKNLFGSLATIANFNNVCTTGFRNLRFYVYNTESQTRKLLVGGVLGLWIVDIDIAPGVWQEVVIPYEALGDEESNLFLIFFVQGSLFPYTLFFDKMELIDGSGGYFSQADFTSSIFDAGQTVAANRLSFTAELPDNTNIGLQLAASANANGPWSFRGPSGTSEINDLYQNQAGEGVYWLENSGRYFRLKAILFSDNGDNTPVLKDFTLNYSL